MLGLFNRLYTSQKRPTKIFVNTIMMLASGFSISPEHFPFDSDSSWSWPYCYVDRPSPTHLSS